MGYSAWDIAQLTDGYRQRKQAQHTPQPTNILDGAITYEPHPLPTKPDSHYGMPSFDTDFFHSLEKELPPIFTRQLVSQKTGGLISAKTLSNLDSLHKGPSVKVRVGSKVGYERSDFLKWLRGRMQ